MLDAIQVLTYARYLKDILRNMQPMPNIEMIKLMEECSAAILNLVLEKDPGYSTITCSIGTQAFHHALCDLGASVSAMPKEVFDNITALSPTPMRL